MHLFEQKSAALYYQTSKLVTLIMALMKSVTTPTLTHLGIVNLFSFAFEQFSIVLANNLGFWSSTSFPIHI